jgi:hypothetical protein
VCDACPPLISPEDRALLRQYLPASDRRFRDLKLVGNGQIIRWAGLCAAAIRDSVPCILVKAICDWADGKKNKKHQPLAAAAALSLVHHVLSQADVLNGLEKVK